MGNTANLTRSTFRADSAREDCTCVRDCTTKAGAECTDRDWHQHPDDPCPVHPPRSTT